MLALRVLWKLIILQVFLAQGGICDDDDEWVMVISGAFASCNDFENKVMNADGMEMGKTTEDGDEATYMSGTLKILKAVEEGNSINLQVSKYTEVGSEPMWGFSTDLCEFLKDEGSPVYKATEQMGIQGCPIAEGDYECDKMSLDTSALKDFMSHEYEGEYLVAMEILDGKMNTLTCHTLSVACTNKNGRK